MVPGGAKRSREVHDFLARETRGGEPQAGDRPGQKRTTGQQKEDNQTGEGGKGGEAERGTGDCC